MSSSQNPWHVVINLSSYYDIKDKREYMNTQIQKCFADYQKNPISIINVDVELTHVLFSEIGSILNLIKTKIPKSKIHTLKLRVLHAEKMLQNSFEFLLRHDEIQYIDIGESTKIGFKGEYVQNTKLKGICMGSDSLERGNEQEPALFLQSIPTLEMLDVSNFFQQDPNYAPRYFPFESMNNLTYVNLAGNYLQEIPENLTLLTNLRYLNLSDNAFSKINIEFDVFERLEKLIMKKTIPNKHDSHIYIDTSLYRCRKLLHLDLSGMMLNNLEEGMEQMSDLTYLDLSFTGLQELPTSVTKLRNLQTLLVRDTNIHEMPTNIGDLTFLRRLDFSMNFIDEIPKSITTLGFLTRLELPMFSEEMISYPQWVLNFIAKVNRIELTNIMFIIQQAPAVVTNTSNRFRNPQD